MSEALFSAIVWALASLWCLAWCRLAYVHDDTEPAALWFIVAMLNGAASVAYLLLWWTA